MRTYLQLVQRLHQDVGASGTAPTSVTGNTAGSEAQRLCDWIADAWFSIQAFHQNWKFLRLSTSFTTVNGQATYTQAQAGVTAGTLGQWIKKSFRVYHTATGFSSEIELDWWDYEDWRDTYQLGVMRTTYSRPLVVTEVPATKGLALGPVPLVGYTVVGDYYRAPIRLAADSDTPGLPENHDSIGIIYKAMLDYGGFEAAGEVYQRAYAGYKEFLSKLEKDQLPPIYFGKALA